MILRRSCFSVVANEDRPIAGRIRCAFTLIELVLVMVVVAIAAALVVPLLSNSARGRRAGDAAAQVVALTQYARSQAVSQGKVYRLVIDPQAGTYGIAMGDPGGWQTLDNWSFRLPEGLSIESDLIAQADGLYLEFKPSGRCDPTTIRIRDRDGSVIQVVCDSATELFRVVN